MLRVNEHTVVLLCLYWVTPIDSVLWIWWRLSPSLWLYDHDSMTMTMSLWPWPCLYDHTTPTETLASSSHQEPSVSLLGRDGDDDSSSMYDLVYSNAALHWCVDHEEVGRLWSLGITTDDDDNGCGDDDDDGDDDIEVMLSCVYCMCLLTIMHTWCTVLYTIRSNEAVSKHIEEPRESQWRYVLYCMYIHRCNQFAL